MVMVGRGEAAKVALTLAAIWYKVEFGGIISIDGSLPIQYQPQSVSQAKSPALILRSDRTIIDETIDAEIGFFDCLDFGSLLGEENAQLHQRDLQPILDFLGHRLRHDEWVEEAVLSFGKLLNFKIHEQV